MSMLDRWKPWYDRAYTHQAYGPLDSYHWAETHLVGLDVADWGAGYGYFRNVHQGGYKAFDGTAILEIVREDGPQSFALRAGMIAVTQGAWHRFHSSEGVTLMAATPSPSKVIELDVDDPRTVEREPA